MSRTGQPWKPPSTPASSLLGSREGALRNTKTHTRVIWRLKQLPKSLKYFQSDLESILTFNWNWKRTIFSNRGCDCSTVTSNNCAYNKVCRCPVTADRVTNKIQRSRWELFLFHQFPQWQVLSYGHHNHPQPHTCLPASQVNPWPPSIPQARRSCCTHTWRMHLRGHTQGLGRAPRADSTNW